MLTQEEKDDIIHNFVAFGCGSLVIEWIEFFLKSKIKSHDEELIDDMKAQMSEWYGNGKLMVEDYQANLIKNNEKDN